MEKTSSPGSSAGHTIKNIMIGVLTPVVAAALIYYFGFNKNDDFEKKKAATIKAWTSYVQNKGIFSKAMKQLGTAADMDVLRNNINHEIDVTMGNMENIKKENDADERVFSTIDVTVAQIKEIKPIMNKFLDEVNTFIATNPTDEEAEKYILGKQETLASQLGDLRRRDSIRLKTFYDGLNKDYETTLPEH
ncbi:MAG: hypothetical protein U0V75_16325 [Ferruginibacter sp.]